jgi:hypothetical protein
MMAPSANAVKNATLAAMLAEAEKSQSDRYKQRLRNAQSGLPTVSNPSLFKVDERRTPAKPKCSEEKETPVKTRVTEDVEETQREAVPLTLDETEWLDEVLERQPSLSSTSSVISRLVNHANSEPPEMKKKLFLVVRCRRCSAGAKGGVKHDREIELTHGQWQWLDNVRERCHHASVGKTLRIIVDFYMPLCREDTAFEQKLLRLGCIGKTGRHEDAVGSVDPARALAIKSFGAGRDAGA